MTFLRSRSTAGLIFALLLALSTAAGAAVESDLLDAAEAFVPSAGVDGNTITVRWKIAEGYYMYEDRFSVAIAEGPAGVSLGEPAFSAGSEKEDEFFGKSVVHFGSAELSLPITGTPAAAGPLKLAVTGQGCNEPVGVCYPPLNTVVELLLPAAAAAAPAGFAPQQSSVDGAGGGFGALGSLIKPREDFLDVDQAFSPDLFSDGGRTLKVHFDIAEGYYLYRHSLSLSPAEPGILLGTPSLPAGVDKTDEYFGDTEVYYGTASFSVPVMSSNSGNKSFVLSYQGCAENGICYPPQERSLVVDTLLSDAEAGVTPPLLSVDGPDRRQAGGFWGFVAAAFGIGIALAFTPCVLPMIPIFSGVIAGDHSPTRSRAGILAVTYVLGTGLTYAIAGALAGATGEQLQAYFQNPWAIGIIVAMLLAMALSMFGLFEIQLPAALQTLLAGSTRKLGGGRLVMVFLLGAVSALIVGACVSPLLISVLGVAMLRGDPVLGAAIMFSLALGTGLLIILFAVGAGGLLPRAGPWMNRVRQAFGVMIVGVAIYLLGVLPEVPVLLLWGAYLIVVGVWLGATSAVRDGNGWRYLARGIGTVLLIWGALALVGGFWGQRDVFNPVPLSLLTGEREAVPADSLFRRVIDEPALDVEIDRAVAAGKRVILDYYADWCVDCVRMERSTFVDARVIQRIEDGFVLLQVDLTDPYDANGKALKSRFGVYGPPALLFFDASGREIESMRLYGYKDAESFLALLDRAATR